MFLRWKKRQVSREPSFEGCQHRVPTTRITPQLLETTRDSETRRPRSKHVWTGKSFRSCCLDLTIERCLWWTAVRRSIAPKLEAGIVTPEKWTMVEEQMGALIPKPTEHELAVFDYEFRVTGRSGESWDEMMRRGWIESERRFLNGEPRLKWRTFGSLQEAMIHSHNRLEAWEDKEVVTSFAEEITPLLPGRG